MDSNTQPTEGDKALFAYVLARSRARESSILTIATITTSASLVLLGLYLQVYTEQHWKDYPFLDWTVKITGILFAVAGILYREITARFIHQNDEDWLNAYVRALGCSPVSKKIINQECSRIQDPLCYLDGQNPRKFILRTLFVLPIIAWEFLLVAPQLYVAFAIAVICMLYPIGILTCDIKKHPTTLNTQTNSKSQIKELVQPVSMTHDDKEFHRRLARLQLGMTGILTVASVFLALGVGLLMVGISENNDKREWLGTYITIAGLLLIVPLTLVGRCRIGQIK
jgi:hypothetical protein